MTINDDVEERLVAFARDTFSQAVCVASYDAELPRPPSLPMLHAAACLAFGRDADAVLTRSRAPANCDVRAAVALVARRMDYTLKAIGRFYGKHHTTILSASRHAEAMIATDPAYRERFERFIHTHIHTVNGSL